MGISAKAALGSYQVIKLFVQTCFEVERAQPRRLSSATKHSSPRHQILCILLIDLRRCMNIGQADVSQDRVEGFKLSVAETCNGLPSLLAKQIKARWAAKFYDCADIASCVEL